MRWTVVVPGALVPAPIAADVIGAARAPQLARLIARARAEAPVAASPSTVGATQWSWLWRRFSGRDDMPITAPYAWRALNASNPPSKIDTGVLWQSDPVHFVVARDHLLVVPLDGADALDRSETMALAAEAQACAHTFGAHLRVIDRHWFMEFEPPWSLQAVPLDVALGASIQHLLPTGDDSARWRRLLTEIQIAWHHHPVNAAREERGARRVNGLWLHGGGREVALPSSRLLQLASDDPATHGWALASGVSATSVLPAATELSARGDALAIWPQLFTAFKAEAWHPWTEAMGRFDAWFAGLAQRAFADGIEVELVLCGRQLVRTVLLTPSDGWRLWRRLTPTTVLAEPLTEDQ
jgi:hypothetical protein